MNVSNSTKVGSSNSVRRLKSKGNKSRNKFLKNTNDKSSFAHVWKMPSSVRIDSNKRETMNLTICQSNASILSTKIVNVANDGSNIVFVSCGKDVFMLSHEKCLARYALSIHSRVKRALFTTPKAVKSRNLRDTFVVVKSRFSVVKTQQQQKRYSKHMTGNLKLLRNLVEKFIGIVRFRNDHFPAITGYGDYVQGNLMICHVYYVEGLGHNLFLVGQFCDGDLEVAFRSNTCYVWKLEGDDLLTGSRKSNLYTISISEMAASSPVCLMSRATSTKSWLWHRRLSHLNFDTINQLTSKDLVNGLLKFKYNKNHLCLSYEQDTSSPSSIIVEDSDALQIVTSLNEPIIQESSIPVMETHSDEQIQEDVKELDGNTIMHFLNLKFEEAESSSNYQDPSNMHEFHQQHRYTNKWTKNHPIQ
nr:retrovirus-related Pol polyprotein from transposon TNT 1-94 [Tanacetum cinerariifolium]